MPKFSVIPQRILDSSVWSLPSDDRVVWLTMLFMADMDGVVETTIPGLARRAVVAEPVVVKALHTFSSPDPYSSNPEHDGRRIEKVDRGWRLLNWDTVLAEQAARRIRERNRLRAYRARKKAEREAAKSNNDGDANAVRHAKTSTRTAYTEGRGTRDEQGLNTSLAVARSPVGSGAPAPQAAGGLASGPAVEERRTVHTVFEARVPGAPNPLLEGKRSEHELELLALIREAAQLTGKDETEVCERFTSYRGPDGEMRRGSMNPASLSDDRLLRSLQDARATLAKLRAKRGGNGRLG